MKEYGCTFIFNSNTNIIALKIWFMCLFVACWLVFCPLTKHFPSFLSRSPGGTPVTRRRSKGGAASLSDPAALIAEALKRKFAQHRHNNSSDKENSLELSPFGSPETPKVCFLQDAPHTHMPVSMVYQKNCKGVCESISYKLMNEHDHQCGAVRLKGLSGPQYGPF